MDGRSLGLQMLDAVTAYVARALAPVSARLDQLNAKLATSLSREDLAAALADLPAPRTDVVSKEEVDAALKAVSAVTDDKFAAAIVRADGLERAVDNFAVSVDELRGTVERLQAAPAPQAGEPGKDATPEMVTEVVQPLFAAESARLQEELATEVVALVKQAVSELPPPAPGVAGANATLEMVEAVVAPLQVELVRDINLQLQNGLDRLANDLPALVAHAVTKAVEAQPKAPSSFFINEAGGLVAVYQNGDAKDIGKVCGENGRPGASIMDGAVDADGQLILRLSDARVVNAGVVRGAPGKDAEGQKGEPGRDSLEIVPLPALDPDKSYPEGTCALYRGGMVRAERQTDPIVNGESVAAGWRVLMDGIAEETEDELDDGRVVERTTVYTSGKVFARKFTNAKLVYREVWREGEYQRGDVVTWGGSAWHCQRRTSGKPRDNDDWKLMVKQGSPGRDYDDPNKPKQHVIARVK